MSITALVFFCLFFLLLARAAFVHPINGLYAYILVLYADPMEAWWGQVFPSIPWSFMSSLIVLGVLLFNKDFDYLARLKESKLFWWLFTFWLWMNIQFVWAINKSLHSDGVVLIFKYLLLFSLIHCICRDTERIRSFLVACILGSCYIGYQGYLYAGDGRMEGIGGAGFRDANTVSMYLGTMLLASGFMILAAKGWQRIAILLAIPLTLNGYILAGSRGGFLAVAMGSIVATYFKPPQIRTIFYTGLFLAACGFIYLSSDLLLERLATLATAVETDGEELESSAASRLEILGYQYEMFKDHPIGGVGYFGTVVLSPIYMPPEFLTAAGVKSSHNTLATVVVSHGLIGLCLYVFMLVSAFKQLLAMRKLARKSQDLEFGLVVSALVCGISVILVAGLFSNYFKAEILIWYLAMTSGLYHSRITEKQTCGNT